MRRLQNYFVAISISIFFDLIRQKILSPHHKTKSLSLPIYPLCQIWCGDLFKEILKIGAALGDGIAADAVMGFGADFVRPDDSRFF